MRPHIALDVQEVSASVAFYTKVFGQAPQKQTVDYAKFDLTAPLLNLSLVSSTGKRSTVNHLGIEVESATEVATWEQHLHTHGLVEKVERNSDCCYARQDKVWFSDPDGNRWEVFTVHEQLPVTQALRDTACCQPRRAEATSAACPCA